jgi:hypothetical protein
MDAYKIQSPKKIKTRALICTGLGEWTLLAKWGREEEGGRGKYVPGRALS